MSEARAPDGVVDITATEFALDPLSGYDRLRQQGPVTWMHPARGFLMTDYDQSAQALRNAALVETDFTRAWRVLAGKLGKTWETSFGLFNYFPFTIEGERHKRLRAAHARGVAPFADARDVFDHRVTRKLDAVRDLEGFDLVEDFAGSLFSEILCDLMGFEDGRSEDFKTFGTLSWALDSTLPVRRRDELEAILSDRLGILIEAVETTLRTRTGTLLHKVHDALPPEETDAIRATASIAAVMLMMGNDAVAGCIAFPVRRLLGGDDGEERFPQARWAEIADDAIRYAAPVDFLNRMTTEDVTIGGCPFRKGERVIVSPLGANHDRSAFGPDPGAVRPRAKGGVGLAFGAGAHLCVGARMSRGIVRSAFEGLAGLPPMRLGAPGRQAPGKVIRAMASLPIVFDRRGGRQ